MSTFIKKLGRALHFIAHCLWVALKAIGRTLSNIITWCRNHLSARTQLLLVAVIMALFIVGGALLFTGHGCTPGSADDDEVEQTPSPEVTYTPDETDVQHISHNVDTITSFSLVESGNQMHAELADEEEQAIANEVAQFENKGDDVGFLIVNLSTGSGFCYNIDTAIYGASTYKAPLSVYLCEEFVDSGRMNLTAVQDRIENAIVWSDNDSYRSLKHGFEGAAHNAWLMSLGIDPSGYAATFPTYSVRDATTLWMHTWDYLNSGTATAEWLADLFSRTDLSFLRNAVEQSDMQYATVYDKGGWCASTSSNENSVNDAGIVIEDENIYVVVAFSNTPDSANAEDDLTQLFKALLGARHNLDASSATWENVEYVEAAPAGMSDGSSENEDDDSHYEMVIVPNDDDRSASNSSQIVIESDSDTQIEAEPTSDHELVMALDDGTSYSIARTR